MQRTLLDTYNSGDYAGVVIMEEAEDYGDTLLNFIAREVSEEEGCNTVDLAIDKMRAVIDDVQSFIDELDKI